MAGRIEQLLADVEPPDYGQGLYDAPKPGAYRSGNKHYVGFECEANGVGERWSDELIEATVTAVRRLVHFARLEPINPNFDAPRMDEPQSRPRPADTVAKTH